MALGDVIDYGWHRSIEILASATAANGAPSGATAGVDVNLFAHGSWMPEYVAICVFSTAGSGAMTASFRLWGYLAGPNDWFPIGAGSDTARGQLNTDNETIGEDEADKLRFVELKVYPSLFQRLYLELESIAGTATAVTGLILSPNTKII